MKNCGVPADIAEIQGDSDEKCWSTPESNARRLRAPGDRPDFDAGQDGAVSYIISDLIDGMNLAVRIAADPPSPRDAARIVAEVAEHLHHAHEQGYIHRDIKPANILIDRQGRTFLTDFGIAAIEADIRRGWRPPGPSPTWHRSN